VPILAAATVACSAAPPKEVAPAAKPVATPAASNPQSRWGVVELASLPGTVTLYDPGRWRPAAGETFSTLEHPPSRSRLALRTWRAAPDVRPAQCEAEARLVRPDLPQVDQESILDSRRIDAPREFHGTLVVGVEPMRDGSTHGFALAVSATVGRCFVLCFETIAQGADAPVSVADRLHEAVEGIIPSVELRGVEERVRPDFKP
jgi:hypothetical protein